MSARGAGFGICQATAYRYKDEAVEVLAAKAPTLREALDKAIEQGLPYLILDGTLISSDRCADKKTSRKGKEIDKWYSGKAHQPAGNVQALAAPGGVPLWVCDVLLGSTHDLTAARELVLPEARPYLKDLPILADSGYEGAGAGVHVPVKKPARGELDIDATTRHALLRSLRYQGERGFALMSQRWRVLQRVMVSPTTIGDIAKSVLVLTLFEHKMIS
jgi:DDE superfamily endonuclease